MEAQLQSNQNFNVLHLTDYDLDYNSRHKSFEQIGINDFNYSLTDAMNATYVYFVDLRKRKKGWWKRLLGIDNSRTQVKQLLP